MYANERPDDLGYRHSSRISVTPPSPRYKLFLISDLRKYLRAVLGLLLGFGAGCLSVNAQILVLPSGLYRWDGGASTQSWSDGVNWYHSDSTKDNQVPPDDAAAFFGALSSFGADLDAREEIVIAGGTSVGSLWFDAHAEGPGYTLSSDGALTLGENVKDEEHIIGVADWYRSRESRILAPTISIHSSAASTVRISNQSMAGLLIAGQPTGINDPLAPISTFDIGAHTLQIRGGSMTHIASALVGTGDINAQEHRTQIVLNANNQGWDGNLIISHNAMAVIKNSNALHSGTTVQGTGVWDDSDPNPFNHKMIWDPFSIRSTLMLRSTTDTAPTGLELNPQLIYVYGQGASRSTYLGPPNPGANIFPGDPSGFSGALYNDGGDNTINSEIKTPDSWTTDTNVWINSRAGNLTLNGKINIAGRSFHKDGLGTVTLTYSPSLPFPDLGNWAALGTYIVQGELRIENSHFALSGGFDALPSFAPTLFFQGGVLGLGVDADFTRKVGDGLWKMDPLPAGSVVWAGSRGGFLARGTTTKTVNLTVSHAKPEWDASLGKVVDPDVTPGGKVSWHKGGFMGSWERKEADPAKKRRDTHDGGVLVLGSETYEGYLIWKNAIYFGNHAQFQAEYEELSNDAGLSGPHTYSNRRVIEIQEGVAEIQGALSGEGFDLVKRGEGLLRLTSTESSYQGGTVIEAGALQGDSTNLAFTNIILKGGVYMPNMTNHRSDDVFNVKLGIGAGEFRWDSTGGGASGGFAAGETDTMIQIGADPVTTPLAWGDEYFVVSGRELILGHAMSGAMLIWNKALDTNGTQTVRVARGRKDSVDYDAVLNQSVSGSGLVIVGDGRLALRKANALNTFSVLGATVTLDGAGRLPGVMVNGVLTGSQILVREAGAFILDNSDSAHDLAGRLGTGSTLTLDGGTFRYRNGTRASETLGTLKLAGGSNAIAIEATGALVMEFAGFQRTEADRATLDLISDAEFSPTGVRLKFPTAQAAFAEFGDMSPWATVNGTDWASQDSTGTVTRLANYVTTAPGTAWTPTSNVNIGSTNRTLDQSRSIHSLRIGSGELSLGANQTLTLNSGGLLFAAGDAGKLSGGGVLTTATGGTIYAHVYGAGGSFGTAEIGAQITGTNIDFVKTGPETLRLTSDGTSDFRNIYVHGGRLELDLGINGRINTTGKIIVGDRSGKDVLRLPKYNNQLTGERHIVLRGGDYGAGVLEFALKPAGLPGATAFAGTTHRLNTLEVQGQGVIDFRGGEVGMANYLYIDDLVIGVGSKLTIRNWFEGEDYLLVHRSKYAEYTYTDPSGLNSGILGNLGQRVQFEGYGRLFLAHYNEDYYEITPFPRTNVTYYPEPSTYGAILGTTGLGLLAWRRRKKSRISVPAHN